MVIVSSEAISNNLAIVSPPQSWYQTIEVSIIDTSSSRIEDEEGKAYNKYIQRVCVEVI